MTLLADLVQTVLNSVLLGGVYAAAAIGLSPIFGAIGRALMRLSYLGV